MSGKLSYTQQRLLTFLAEPHKAHQSDNEPRDKFCYTLLERPKLGENTINTFFCEFYKFQIELKVFYKNNGLQSNAIHFYKV